MIDLSFGIMAGIALIVVSVILFVVGWFVETFRTILFIIGIVVLVLSAIIFFFGKIPFLAILGG